MNEEKFDQLAEALRANANLDDSRRGLRELVDRASRVTSGKIHFLYTTVPESTEYFVFQGDGQRRNYKEALGWLNTVIADPTRFVELTDAELAAANRERHVGR